MITFSKELFKKVKPHNLREFYQKVLQKPLGTIRERGELFEAYGLGEAEEYIGLAGQNQAILDMLYLVAEQSELPFPS